MKNECWHHIPKENKIILSMAYDKNTFMTSPK
jgi:hypothetical protein